MEKINDFELKLYEILGVKLFRNLAFKTRDIFFFWLKKPLKDKILYEISNNYIIGKGDNFLRNLKNYKKEIKKNTIIHTVSLIVCLPMFLRYILGLSSLGYFIFAIILFVLNSYCLMLQRYNNIKINRTIKNYEIREMERKEVIRRELEEAKSKINKDIDIVVFDRRANQKVVTFDEFIELASVKQLKDYKKFLELQNIEDAPCFLIDVSNLDDIEIKNSVKK